MLLSTVCTTLCRVYLVALPVGSIHCVITMIHYVQLDCVQLNLLLSATVCIALYTVLLPAVLHSSACMPLCYTTVYFCCVSACILSVYPVSTTSPPALPCASVCVLCCVLRECVCAVYCVSLLLCDAWLAKPFGLRWCSEQM